MKINSTIQMKTQVKEIDTGHAVYANKALSSDEIVLCCKNYIIRKKATRHSLQIAFDKHMELSECAKMTEEGNWRFLNHSCNPNIIFNRQKMSFIATKSIKFGEQLCFNYNTTEYDMEEPFICNCGNENCLGNIAGYKTLLPEQKNAIAPYVAYYLKDL